jgi:hypothetical protein
MKLPSEEQTGNSADVGEKLTSPLLINPFFLNVFNHRIVFNVKC